MRVRDPVFGRDKRHRNKRRLDSVAGSVARIEETDFRQLTPAPIRRNREWELVFRQNREWFFFPQIAIFRNFSFL